jgi:hypothetical protein
MGLQERQAWASIKDETQQAAKEVANSAGAPIELSINESSFATKALIDGITTYVLPHYTSGFADLCSDALAKEAVQGGVKKVVINHRPGDQFTMNLDGGVLNVDGNFDGSGMCGIAYPHSNDYKTYLTKTL